MAADDLTLAGTVLAGALLGLVVLFVLRDRRLVAAYLVGGTGALVGAQIASVHLFTAAIGLWLLFTRPAASRQWLRVLLLMTVAGMLVTTVLFGDLVNSPTLALQLLALTGSASLIALGADARDGEAMLRAALAVITVGALVGLGQMAGIVPIETWHVEVSALGRPTGIWPEPDWLGLLAAVGVVLAWRLPLGPWLRTVALTVNSAGVVLSFARAAWVALAVSVAVLVVTRMFARRRASAPDRGGRGRGLVVLLLLGVLALAVSPELRSDLGRRVDTLTGQSTEDVSGQARLQQTRALLYLADTAAPFGHGLSASGRVGVSGALLIGVQSPNNVGSNWMISLWVDGALLALPLILFMLIFALRGTVEPPGQALLLVLVNSLFSNGFFQPITWLLLGLTMAALAPRPSPAAAPAVAREGRPALASAR